MEIQIREKNGWSIIDIEGDFRGSQAQKFKDQVLQCIEQQNLQVIANFKNVSFIDSTGMGAVIHCFQRVKVAGGQLALMSLSDEIYDLFEMTSVDKLFTILDSEEEIQTTLQ